MRPRLKHIRKLPLQHKHRHLRFAHDQLRPVFDFILIPRKSPHQRILAVVRPLNDVDQLVAEFVENAHVEILLG